MTKASRFAGGLLVLVALFLPSACGTGSANEGNSDLVDELSCTFDSPEALAKAFLEALRKEDLETLKAFALNKDEFQEIVWPQLPSSRPERGVPFEYGWNDLREKSFYSLSKNFARYKGRPLDFRELVFHDETTDYGTYLVHRDARVKVYDEKKDREFWVDLFGSILEKDGRFKLFSYVTD
jgi:hypothetical protein